MSDILHEDFREEKLQAENAQLLSLVRRLADEMWLLHMGCDECSHGEECTTKDILAEARAATEVTSGREKEG